MSFLDFSIKIKLLVEEINATREEESILIGDELRKQVRTRVQKQKVNADGSPFGQYSQALLPQWFFYDKSKTDTAEDKIRSGDWFISYADFREVNDLYSGDIDFTFTGDMWRNTGVTEVQNDGDSVVVFIGGQTTRASNILGWQEPRYGNILEANEEEERFVEEAHRERIFNKIARYL